MKDIDFEPVSIVLRVIRILEKFQIPYMLGGSFASSAYGIPRATHDADLIADLHQEAVEPFVKAFKNDFYIDPESVQEAVNGKSSFNLIHYESAFKIDVFIADNTAYSQETFKRKQKQVVAPAQNRSIYMLSPEDTVLSKLCWYRMGGERSDSQWKDILGVIKVQARRLDTQYIFKWAAAVKVADLAEKAFAQANLK